MISQLKADKTNQGQPDFLAKTARMPKFFEFLRNPAKTSIAFLVKSISADNIFDCLVQLA
jgi:hypothetical protein